MAGARFLSEELYASVEVLGFTLATYIIFLGLALFLRQGASPFLRFLAFLQMFALPSTPFILTLLERNGLKASDSGLRLLEELALHAVRYKVFIRPLMGYIGVFCDAFAFRIIYNRNNRIFHVYNVHKAARTRACSNSNSSWVSILGGEGGPVTAWIFAEPSIRIALQKRTGPGKYRADFGVIIRGLNGTPGISPLTTPLINAFSHQTPSLIPIFLPQQHRTSLQKRRSRSPYAAGAEEILPYPDALKVKKWPTVDALESFASHVLAPRMNRLVPRCTEHLHYLSMGKLFLEGRAVVADYEKSALFFQCAISYGNREACVYLGRQYEQGLGISKDAGKAVQLFQNGAELQDSDCLYEMGQCFQYGYGVEKDDVKAFELYSKAANVGHSGSQTQLGVCQYEGKGTEIDLEESAKNFKAAAEAGDEGALWLYGRCILHGEGVEKNLIVRVDLLEMAVSAGSINALAELGDCYRKGWGVDQDMENAFRLYNEAADENSLEALVKVAICLLNGWGAAQDETKGAGTFERRLRMEVPTHCMYLENCTEMELE